MAHVMNEEDFDNLRKLFIKIDINDDGKICACELRKYLNINANTLMVKHFRSNVIEKILQVIDQNQN
jgi:Ca2+-binding EF-hand superfamily protein